MSVAGIASSILSNLSGSQSQQQNPFQQIKSEFSQLGQDLQSGNLSQAQSDFTTLTQNLSAVFQGGASSSPSTSPSANPILQAFSQLGQDLQSGNLQAAQQDFTAIQQDAQQAAPRAGGHHHHHHLESSQNSSSLQTNPVNQAFSQLTQSLQSGNLQGAQQAYSTLQADLQQIGGFSTYGANSSGSTGATSGSLNVNA